MKQLVLFAFAFLFNAPGFAQNYINEILIEHELQEADAYFGLGQMKQTSASIRTLDSLGVGMVITKKRYQGADELAHMGVDTFYVHNGRITELVKFQYCWRARIDSKGRVMEKLLSNSPNSPVEEIRVFQYDSMGFPIYWLRVEPASMVIEDKLYRSRYGDSEDRIAIPHYNSQGILDTIRYSGGGFVFHSYATLKQAVYKNGDSIVITRTFYDTGNGFRSEDYFVRTVNLDTVQVRFYQNRIDHFQEYTRNKVNGLEVESYFEPRGAYTHATTYNRLGLPVEELGSGVTNEGNGNIITQYEYYAIDREKKCEPRLVKMK